LPEGSDCVRRWLSDVARSVSDRASVLEALKSERRALEELDRMPKTYTAGKIEATRGRIAETVERLEAMERAHAAKVPEFLALMEQLPDALVARALVLRCLHGKTWQQCAIQLHVNRQHLERCYKASIPDLAKLVPSRYRGDGA